MPLPRYQQLDAPLMGNGDMAVAVCGNPENQQFWLSKNDLLGITERLVQERATAFRSYRSSHPAASRRDLPRGAESGGCHDGLLV